MPHEPSHDSTATDRRPRVVVVGAGFAGLNAAKALRGAPVDVLMIDQHNYHTFQPLLYQVATAGLAIDDIAHQARDVFRGQGNYEFRQGTVTGVDWDAKHVLLAADDVVPFDYLVVGAGAIYNDFGTPGVYEHAFLLKSLSEATNIRSHILRQFELASAHPERIDDGLLDFVLVGGGPTGVEMAGALVELFEKVLPRDYPEIDFARVRVILLEMTDALLLPFSKRTQAYTRRVLERRGVDVRLGTTVKEVREDAAVLGDGSEIRTRTLIWAAGVRAHPLVEALGVELTRGYRVVVEPDLSLPGKPYAFVAGDAAGAAGEDGKPLPQVAQVAIQQGKHAAREIVRRIEGEASRPFRYLDKGIMAIIGRNAGVAELSRRFGGLKLRGFLGWLGWLFVHLVYLPGHQNRFSAFATWTYNYFTYDRHARLITDMAPSPAEVTGHTNRMISPQEVASRRRADERAPGRNGEVVREPDESPAAG